jgi:hypothetical protein
MLKTYLRTMKRLRTYSLLLAASAAMFPEGYREAQRSNVNY